MEIQLAVSKINKYGSPESGDTLEVVERPNGGLSVALCDGQASGRIAKAISGLVVRKVIGLLAEGVRDGAAARAASDYLFTEKNGGQYAFLNILSIDLQTSTIVITRNNPTPIFVGRHDQVECLGGESQAIGTSRNIRPLISEIPLQVNITIVMYTDGIANAGRHYGQQLDVCMLLQSILEDQEPSSKDIADSVIYQAMRLDQGQPADDMSVVVLRVLPKERDSIRRMIVSIPFQNEFE